MFWPFRRREVADASASAGCRGHCAAGAAAAVPGPSGGGLAACRCVSRARPGIGLTFAELRAYEPGDDVRHLDWNVTARQGRPFVRRFVEERALSLWLVVDVSASMRFGPERTTKADRAAQAAALLATAAIQNGDRAGLDPGQRSDRARARSGRRRPPPLAVGARAGGDTDHLAQDQAERRAGTGAADGPARHAGRHQRFHHRRAGCDPGGGPPGATTRSPCASSIPAKTKLPDAGLLALEDAERGSNAHGRFELGAGCGNATPRPPLDRSQAFQRWCANSGIQAFTMTTDVDPIVPLIELFSRRATRRGGR